MSPALFTRILYQKKEKVVTMEAVRERIEEDGKPCVSSEKREKRDKRVGIIAYLLFGISILASLYLLAYTPIHNWFHSMRMAEIIADYDQKAAELSDEELSAIREAALAYNSRLELGTHFQPTQEELDEYSAQLDFTGTGMMGYIQIPKLKVKLPIYHTTSEEVMEEAVGHIPGSSLPVGGVTCHTVLCAHRDLPTAYLFHDLDKLEMGDTFTLTVLNETVTYAVDQVTVVRPQDVEDLSIEPGQDYCTLVTCHPHGSSEFRMLVRGRRVA